MDVQRLPGYTPRRDLGLSAYERVLARAGLEPVAGIDEAGRGACAGPLVVAAVALNPRRRSRLTGIADSKALTVSAREAAYEEVVASALAWHVVVIPPGDIDRLGLHVCNVTGMRRALAGLACRPGYVLTDGFPVRGLAVPALAMWKGDEVAACVAAASIVAKVTRDQIMRGLHKDYPEYGFSRHKGYSTPSHMTALTDHGPCPEHRMSFANVIGVVRKRAGLPELTGSELAGSELAGAELGGPELAGPELAGSELAGAELGDPGLAGPDLTAGEAFERLAGDGAEDVAGNKAELSYG
jgi:ribonuclease HII